MKTLFPIEMIDGHMAHIDPDHVVAITPAHQQSNLAPGSTLVAGSMLILTGGTAMPVKGTPEMVIDLIAKMTVH